MITNENEVEETNKEQPLFENSGLLIESYLKIWDDETKEEIVNMRA